MKQKQKTSSTESPNKQNDVESTQHSLRNSETNKFENRCRCHGIDCDETNGKCQIEASRQKIDTKTKASMGTE